MTPRILLVDDEQGILNSLRRLLRQEGWEIDLTPSPMEALKYFEKNVYSLVISDQRMPHMLGAELLEKIQGISPETVRILLTGYTDMQAAMDAINKGGIYRFLTKPWNDDELKITVRKAIEHAELENSFMGTIRILASLSEKHSSTLGSHSKRVSKIARNIAVTLGLPPKEILPIEIAATLHDIGKIGLPETLVQKESHDLREDEKTGLRRHVEIADALLSSISSLSHVAKIVRHHHESMNGSGYPDHLQNDKIPLGSRIIHVSDAFDKACFSQTSFLSSEDAFRKIVPLAKTDLDSEVLSALKENLSKVGANSSNENEVELRSNQLSIGMTLSHDLKTIGGNLLLQKDKEINVENFARIKRYLEQNPFTEGIFVYRKRG